MDGRKQWTRPMPESIVGGMQERVLRPEAPSLARSCDRGSVQC